MDKKISSICELTGASLSDLAGYLVISERLIYYHYDHQVSMRKEVSDDVNELLAMVLQAEQQTKEMDIPRIELSASQRKLLEATIVRKTKSLRRYEKQLEYIRSQWEMDHRRILLLQELNWPAETTHPVSQQKSWRNAMIGKAMKRIWNLAPGRVFALRSKIAGLQGEIAELQRMVEEKEPG